MRQIVIGSRGSQLALWQSAYISEEIKKCRSSLKVKIEVVRTSGDKMSETALAKISSTKGLFVKEIEEALLEGKVDLAVHSLKDLPTDLPEGLCLGAIPRREDPRDVLVREEEISSLDELPHAAKLATSSLRRTVQLGQLRPDINVQPLRGNIDTRIRKMSERGLDGIVLAAAGLKRLGLEKKIAYVFPIREMLPAISQGALAIEIRADDRLAQEVIAPLENTLTRRCTQAERLFLRKMGGGCQVPLGAYATVEDGAATFEAFVASAQRRKFIRKISRGLEQELDDLALETADYLLSHGGKEMLEEVDSQ